MFDADGHVSKVFSISVLTYSRFTKKKTDDYGMARVPSVRRLAPGGALDAAAPDHHRHRRVRRPRMTTIREEHLGRLRHP